MNIVHGLGTTTGQAIVAHPKIKAISFTGGTQTGAHIARVAAPMFKKLSLELGGKIQISSFPIVIMKTCCIQQFDLPLPTKVRFACVEVEFL